MGRLSANPPICLEKIPVPDFENAGSRVEILVPDNRLLTIIDAPGSAQVLFVST